MPVTSQENYSDYKEFNPVTKTFFIHYPGIHAGVRSFAFFRL
jgi:hypothetical protein